MIHLSPSPSSLYCFPSHTCCCEIPQSIFQEKTPLTTYDPTTAGHSSTDHDLNIFKSAFLEGKYAQLTTVVRYGLIGARLSKPHPLRSIPALSVSLWYIHVHVHVHYSVGSPFLRGQEIWHNTQKFKAQTPWTWSTNSCESSDEEAVHWALPLLLILL